MPELFGNLLYDSLKSQIANNAQAWGINLKAYNNLQTPTDLLNYLNTVQGKTASDVQGTVASTAPADTSIWSTISSQIAEPNFEANQAQIKQGAPSQTDLFNTVSGDIA